MNLPDARRWFRFRSKITTYIKENTSLIFRDDMQCRYCTKGANKRQEHLEECELTRKRRRSLNLKKERERMILWRKKGRALKELYKKDKNTNNSI